MTGKERMLTIIRASEEKEVVSVPKFSREKLYAGMIVALIVGLVIGYGSSIIQITTLQNQLQTREQQYQTLVDFLKEPRTTIVGGNVTWRFMTLDGTMQEWYMPMDAYVYYVDKPKPEEYHVLSTDEETFHVRNMELFVEPEFFSGVIGSLTDGNSDREFVQEVFNLRVQLTVYSEELTETPQWSGETMTLGTGDCEDLAILMGSLLTSGNEHVDYGMTVKMVYMDAYNPTDPQTPNHVMIHITYGDGAGEFLDSTSISVQSPWSNVVGWYFDL